MPSCFQERHSNEPLLFNQNELNVLARELETEKRLCREKNTSWFEIKCNEFTHTHTHGTDISKNFYLNLQQMVT